jgi:hypothetical protein
VIGLVFAVYQLSNGISKDESQNSVVGTAFVGDWQDVNNPASVIQIQPNGGGSCQIVHGVSHYSINGGKATFDKKTQHLAIKLFFLGPNWHVDEAPHQTANGMIMKLDGDTFRKLRSFPSPTGSEGPGSSI